MSENRFGWISESDYRMIIDSLDESLSLECSLYAEIGCFHFKMSRAIYDRLKRSGKKFTLVSIDHARSKLWHDQFADRIDCGDAVFLHGDSAEIAKIFHSRFAFVFIDGCHCIDCASADINSWAPKIVSGGWLLLHDTAHRWQKDKREKKGVHMQIAVREAVEKTNLLATFDFVEENEERYGMQTYQRKQ